MSVDPKLALKHRYVNGWWLFGLLSIPLSMLMVFEMAGVDMSQPTDVSHMIGYSVRASVPFIYLVIAASSLHILFPGAWSMWLLRNRKYFGLVFAVAMAWQGAFIAIMSSIYREYYFEEVYFFRDELEGSTGYIFLAAMVVTSFQFGRRYLSARQWKLIHKSGIYFLWAYPFAVYWWNLFYYENPEPIDYVFYWSGFFAFAVRIAAWGKKRRQGAQKTDFAAPVAAKIAGAVIIASGFYAAATGLKWQDRVTTYLTSPAWSENLELWLPFWPFEPFLPLFIVGLGVMIWTAGPVQSGARMATRAAD